jgi:hypothetical protein
LAIAECEGFGRKRIWFCGAANIFTGDIRAFAGNQKSVPLAPQQRRCAAQARRYPLPPLNCNSRHRTAVCRKHTRRNDSAPNLSPSLTHRRDLMTTATFRTSVLDQVAVTAVLVVTALMTIYQIALLL